MINTALLQNLIDRYSALAYAHNYIWGFTVKGNVYMAVTDSSVLPYICTLDKASRGAGYALRFSPNATQKMVLLPQAELLCSEKFFNEMVAESKYNKGEIFEKLVTEKFGQEWTKDHVPFTVAGDIELDGIAYQIKFQKATFTNEKLLKGLE